MASRFRLRHGEAVGIGLLAAVRAAEALGVLPARAAARKVAEVLALEPPRSPRALLPEALRAVRRDKKAGPKGLTLVLPTERGAVVREGVAVAVFRDALARALGEVRG